MGIGWLVEGSGEALDLSMMTLPLKLIYLEITRDSRGWSAKGGFGIMASLRSFMVVSFGFRMFEGTKFCGIFRFALDLGYSYLESFMSTFHISGF